MANLRGGSVVFDQTRGKSNLQNILLDKDLLRRDKEAQRQVGVRQKNEKLIGLINDSQSAEELMGYLRDNEFDSTPAAANVAGSRIQQLLPDPTRLRRGRSGAKAGGTNIKDLASALGSLTKLQESMIDYATGKPREGFEDIYDNTLNATNFLLGQMSGPPKEELNTGAHSNSKTGAFVNGPQASVAGQEGTPKTLGLLPQSGNDEIMEGGEIVDLPSLTGGENNNSGKGLDGETVAFDVQSQIENYFSVIQQEQEPEPEWFNVLKDTESLAGQSIGPILQSARKSGRSYEEILQSIQTNLPAVYEWIQLTTGKQ